jgi:phosphoheptose isomerase
MPAIALTADPVVLTAWSNDASFESVFARQLQAFGGPDDALVAISTSGRSPNVLRALEAARDAEIRTIALLGRGGGDARAVADVSVVVPSDDTQRIQEVHAVVLHLLCELVEARLHPRTMREHHAKRERRARIATSAARRKEAS